MMGETFALKLKEYLYKNNIKTKGMGVIRLNPDKCKHLETATIFMFE